jgi:hypothetical protein
VLVLVAIVVVIIAVVTGKRVGGDDLNLSRPSERGPMPSRTTWAHSVSKQRVSIR